MGVLFSWNPDSCPGPELSVEDRECLKFQGFHVRHAFFSGSGVDSVDDEPAVTANFDVCGTEVGGFLESVDEGLVFGDVGGSFTEASASLNDVTVDLQDEGCSHEARVGFAGAVEVEDGVDSTGAGLVWGLEVEGLLVPVHLCCDLSRNRAVLMFEVSIFELCPTYLLVAGRGG